MPGVRMLKPRKVLAILCSAYRDDELEKVSLQMDCIQNVDEILKSTFSLTPQSFQNQQQTRFQACREGMFSKALFRFLKILQNFPDYPSHRIFRHMHKVLNIDENKRKLHGLVEIDETNLLSLVST